MTEQAKGAVWQTILNYPADDLIKKLSSVKKDDVINACGALGALAETRSGISLLLNKVTDKSLLISRLNDMINLNDNYIRGNASLVFARLTISEDGIMLILNSKERNQIVKRLVKMVNPDNFGCGSNAAFTLGRIVEKRIGLELLFSDPSTLKSLTCGLAKMLSVCLQASPNYSTCKDACFCLLCLVSSARGNTWVSHDSSFLYGHSIINQGEPINENATKPIKAHSGETIDSNQYIPLGAFKCLVNLIWSSNNEAAWFATLVLRTFTTHRQGYLALKMDKGTCNSIKKAILPENQFSELGVELRALYKVLEPLLTPKPPTISYYGTSFICLCWSKSSRKLPVEIFYEVYMLENDSNKGFRLIYRGSELTTLVENVKPSSEYAFKLRMRTEIEESAFSDRIIIKTHPSLQDAPQNLRPVAVAPRHINLSWLPPERKVLEVRCYIITLGSKIVNDTERTSALISGLSPGHSYNISVMALFKKGPGSSAVVSVITPKFDYSSPSKPIVRLYGNTEMRIFWEAPVLPLSKVFCFEVYLNAHEQPVYRGLRTDCYVRGLLPDKTYSVQVIAITPTGKCKSEVTVVKTEKCKTPKRNYSVLEKTMSTDPVFNYTPEKLAYPFNNQSSENSTKEHTDIYSNYFNEVHETKEQSCGDTFDDITPSNDYIQIDNWIKKDQKERIIPEYLNTDNFFLPDIPKHRDHLDVKTNLNKRHLIRKCQSSTTKKLDNQNDVNNFKETGNKQKNTKDKRHTSKYLNSDITSELEETIDISAPSVDSNTAMKMTLQDSGWPLPLLPSPIDLWEKVLVHR